MSIKFNHIQLNLIKLFKFNQILSDQLFFSNFGMTRVVSQRLFSRTIMILRFFGHTLYFVTSFESKKTRIDILRRSVQFSARELRSETIS